MKSRVRSASALFAFLLIVGMSATVMGQTTAPSTRPVGAMPANPSLPTIWLVGDSTMNNSAAGGMGWGTPFIKMFDPAKVNVVNRAIGGRSSRSYQVEGHWDRVLSTAKPGDFVLLQMGHNDGGGVASPNGRPSLRGLGEETQEVDKRGGGKEVVHTYGWYMRKYVSDARAKGLTIIILSSVPHMPHEVVPPDAVETRFVQVGWAEEVAKSEKVPFINVNKIVMGHYAGMDPKEIEQKYFARPAVDGTHTNPVGAEFHATCVVEGIKQLKEPNLSKYLLEKS